MQQKKKKRKAGGVNGQHAINSKWYINEDRDTPYVVCRSLVAQSNSKFDELMINANAEQQPLQIERIPCENFHFPFKQQFHTAHRDDCYCDLVGFMFEK